MLPFRPNPLRCTLARHPDLGSHGQGIRRSTPRCDWPQGLQEQWQCFERNENSFTIKIRNKKNKKKIFNETSKNKMKEVCNICKCVMFLLFLFSKKEKE